MGGAPCKEGGWGGILSSVFVFTLKRAPCKFTEWSSLQYSAEVGHKSIEQALPYNGAASLEHDTLNGNMPWYQSDVASQYVHISYIHLPKAAL